MILNKTCVDCGIEKPISDFYIRTSGYAWNYCKPCQGKRTSVYGKTGRRNNTLSYLLRNARARAKKNGIPFTITTNDISIPANCPVLGIPLSANTVKASDNSPSIDRIDNDKGYIPGNVVIISHRANTLKKDATTRELALLASFYCK